MINNFEYEFTLKSITLYKAYAVLDLEFLGVAEKLYTFRKNTAKNIQERCNEGDLLYICGFRQKDKNNNIQLIAKEIFLLDGDNIKANMSDITEYTKELEQDI